MLEDNCLYMQLGQFGNVATKVSDLIWHKCAPPWELMGISQSYYDCFQSVSHTGISKIYTGFKHL